MTNPPGEGHQPPEPPPDHGSGDAGESGTQEQPGYWQQQASGQSPPPPPQPYGQPGYGQPAYGQPGYGQPYAAPGYGAPAYAPDHPRATTSMVLGILGIVLCSILAPFAWSIGKKTVAEIDASGGQMGGRGAAQAGYIMGIVGTILLIIVVSFFVLLIIGAVVGSVGSAS